jgi:hypothetical protein
MCVVLDGLVNVSHQLIRSAKGAVDQLSHALQLEVRTVASTSLVACSDSQQHHQADLVSPIRVSARTAASHRMPYGCQHEQLHRHTGVSTNSCIALALVSCLPHLDLASTEGKGVCWGGHRRTVQNLQVYIHM